MALVASLASLRGFWTNYGAQAVGIYCLSSMPPILDRPELVHIDRRKPSSRIDDCSWRKPRLLQLPPTNASQTLRCLCLGKGFGSASALLDKKCTPCSSKDLQPLTKEMAEMLLEQVPGWSLEDIDGTLQLKQSLKTKNFVKGLDLMKEIGGIAESEGHHPDLHLVSWNHLEIFVSTHAIGGLSENDFILAAKISALNKEGYLKKNVKKLVNKRPTEER